MKKITEKIREINPEIRLKEFSFVELDYNAIVPDERIARAVDDIQGFRIWKRDTDNYEIQENSRFIVGLTLAELLKKIEDIYNQAKRLEAIEKVKIAQEKARKEAENLEKMRDKLNTNQHLSKDTLEFLLSLE